MKIFIEEYGLALLSIIAIISMVAFIPGISTKVGNLLGKEGKTLNNRIEETSVYVNAAEMVRVESVLLADRLADETLRTDYSIVADQHKTKILELEQSENFISPFNKEEYNLTATPWHYGDDLNNAVHLGLDYGIPSGSNLVAPANGIIIASGQGCGVGFLGSKCKGRGDHTVSGGGNQIFFITSIKDRDGVDRVFVFGFFHLLDNTLNKTGVVRQGEVIAKTGTSGNSTGPHCHTEVYYLGEGTFADIENYYLRTKYSSSFGNGWGQGALEHICEDQDTINEVTEEEGSCRLDARRVLPQKEKDMLEGWKFWE